MDKTAVWIIIILIAASAFRLTALDLIEFKTDQANIVLKMEQFYSHPRFFMFGPKTSIPAQNFPLDYYVLAAVSIFSRDPLFFAGIIALINVIAIIPFYLIVKNYYGNFTAVVSALLLSLSPWTILYSRQIWTPDLIIPLTIPLFYFLHKLILGKDQKAILGTAASSLIMLQWHPTGVLLATAVCLTLILLRVKINIKYLIFGLILGLIPALPYFVYEITSNPLCPDCTGYMSYVTEVQNDRKLSQEFFTQPFQMINGLAVIQFLGESGVDFYQYQPFLKLLNIIFIISSGILFIAVYFVLKERRFLFLLLLTLLVSILLFITRSSPYDYYQLVIALPVVVLYALSIRYIYSYSKAVGLIILAVILTSNILYIYSFDSFLNQKEDIEGAYGPIYRSTLRRLSNKLESTKNFANSNLNKYQILFDYFNDLNPAFKSNYQDRAQ